MQFGSMSKFLFSLCLHLSLSLSPQCSGSFYSISGKKEGCSCISLTDFCVEQLQLAFRDDMESSLPLNEENCWISVGERKSRRVRKQISEEKMEQNWEIRKVPSLSLWLCYANSLCLICNVEIMISTQLPFPLVD